MGVGAGAGAGVVCLGGAETLDGGRGAVRAGLGVVHCGDGLVRGRGAVESSGEGVGREL